MFSCCRFKNLYVKIDNWVYEGPAKVDSGHGGIQISEMNRVPPMGPHEKVLIIDREVANEYELHHSQSTMLDGINFLWKTWTYWTLEPEYVI